MSTKVIAFIVIVAGIIMVAYTGFNYVTTEKVVDIGPVQISKEKNNKKAATTTCQQKLASNFRGPSSANNIHILMAAT